MAKIDQSRMTVASLKCWSKENKRLALAVVAATASASVMRERVNEVEREVLTEIPMYTDCRGCRDHNEPIERIFDGKLLYLSGDSEGFERYVDECDKRERERGIKPADMPHDHCPALVAEHLQTKAENALMDSAQSVTGIGSQDVWLERRTEYLRLVMGLALNS